MPTTAAQHPHSDPAGLAWQAQLDAAWEAAQSEAEWEATKPPLPDFDAVRPGHVIGPVFGGYCYDPRLNRVHRVASAMPDCRLDALDPRHDYHFWHEVIAGLPDAATCPACLPVRKETAR